jgi:ribonuclease Z
VNTIKKIILAALLLVVAAAVVFAVFKQQVEDYIVEQAIRTTMSKPPLTTPDGITVVLAGTGSPMPDANRIGPCLVVLVANKIYVIDAGQGAARNIMLCGINIGKVNAVLLTHFHSDHIGSLGDIMLQRWIGGSNDTPLDVIGPPGVEQVVDGFNAAYKLDDGYRTAHHGARTAPPTGAGGIARPFTLDTAFNASTVIVNENGLKITAFKVDHFPAVPAVGYKFEYKGRSLVISGDTKYSESLAEQAVGADLLLHEALNTKLVSWMSKYSYLRNSPSISKVLHDIPFYHTTPEEVAKIAQRDGVKKVILYHTIPPIPSGWMDDYFLGDAKNIYSGPISVGEDGMMITLPANSTEIETKYLLKK